MVRGDGHFDCDSTIDNAEMGVCQSFEKDWNFSPETVAVERRTGYSDRNGSTRNARLGA